MFNDYLKKYSFLSAIILFFIGAINYTVDPLWYGKGNKINATNIAFNERLTKTNLYLHNAPKEKYDCLIFGSSRTTLLNTSLLKKNNCFNYSFSAGTAEDFFKYAKYIEEKGVSPKKVYIGVDAFNFDAERAIKHNIKIEERLPLYQSYLFSKDTLKLSINTILRRASLPRYYDDSFQVKVFEDTAEYKPKFIEQTSNNNSTCDFTRISYYKKLKALFPQAEFIAYVPPVSIWELYNKSYHRGILNCQLKGIHRVSQFFDAMYDFSYPSAVTANVANTYDGSHFYPQVNNTIAKVIEGRESNFGIRVDRMSVGEYQKFYRKRLKIFLKKLGKEKLFR